MALQIRRGTNKERLQITPAEGELIYVTDYELATISGTAINASTNVITSVAHGLTTNQQIRFQDTSKNGLTLNQVYYVASTPDPDNFTLKTTLTGTTLDITGTWTTALTFAVGPTDSAGAPLGINVTALWIGDGNTVGGVPGNTQGLDDLTDVTITTPAEGNTLYYDATSKQWKNTNILNIDDVSGTQNINVNGTGASYITINDAVTNGPSAALILRHTSSGTVAQGFGTTMAFEAEVVDGTAKTIGYIDMASTDATSGNEDYTFNVGLMKAGQAAAAALSLDSTGNLSITNDLYVAGGDITTAAGGIANLYNNNAVDTINIGNSVVTEVNIGNTASGRVQIKAGTIVGANTTQNVFNTQATTVNAFGAATALTMGATSGTTTIRNNAVITGNLTVNGTTTTVNSTTMTVDDPNMVLNAVGSPDDTTANNGGITVKGSTDKQLYWSNSDKRWYFDNGTGGQVDGANKMVVDLTDIRNVETTAFNKGQMFFYDGSNWINGRNLTFANDDYRPWFITQVNNASNSINSALVLMKDYDTNSYGNGAGTGIVFGIDSNGQGAIGLSRLSTSYDSNNAHNVVIGTNITSSTYNNLIETSTLRTNINDGVVYIDAQNGRLGINTITPNLSLEVQGNAYISSTLEVISDLTTRSNLNVGGETITLNYGYTGTPTQDVGLVVERGDGADTSWKWIESSDSWSTSDSIYANQNIVAGTVLATNGLNIYFNNDDGTPAGTDHANLVVKRGSGADVSLRWNESTDRWQTTKDGSTYLNLPNQNLDTTDDATFNNVYLNGTAVFLNNDVTGTPSENAYFRVMRGTSPYAELVWDESLDRWRYGVNGVSYISMPNQALDTTNTPTFNNLNLNGTTLLLNNDTTGTPSENVNIEVERGDSTNAYLRWNESTDTWNISNGLVVNGDLTVQGNGYIYSSSNLALTLSGQDVYVAGSLSTGNNTTLGSDENDTITMNGLVTGNISFTHNDTATPRGVLGKTSTGAEDFWFVGGAETGGTSNAGYLMLASGDDGTEPIYARQYVGSPLSGTISRELILLDANGATKLSGDLILGSNVIKASGGTPTTAITLNDGTGDVSISGELTISGDVIKKSTGTNVITFSGTNLTTFAGDIKLGGDTIYDSLGNNVLDFRRTTSIYGTSYQAKFNTSANYGVGASYLYLDNMVEINTSSLTTNQNSTYAVLDYFDPAQYRSAKYIVQITNGTTHQMWEGMVIHDGTDIFISAYGDLRTNGNLATMSVGFNATTGYPELRVLPVNATQTKFKATKTYIAV